MNTSEEKCWADPTLALPKVTLPGRALAWAIRSLTLWMGDCALTTRMFGWSTMRMMGAKTFCGSNGGLA